MALNPLGDSSNPNTLKSGLLYENNLLPVSTTTFKEGDVVVISGTTSYDKTTTANNRSVLGVYRGAGVVVKGVAYITVIDAVTIAIGDALITSTTSGAATVATGWSANSIAVALEAKTSGDGTTRILAYISKSSEIDAVTITSPQIGEILVYNGSEWVNQALTVDSVEDNFTAAENLTAGNVVRLGNIAQTNDVIDEITQVSEATYLTYATLETGELFGQQFTTTVATAVKKVILKGDDGGGGGSASSGQIRIYGDSGSDTPSGLLGTSDTVFLPNAVAEITYTFSTAVQLSAATKYWVVYNTVAVASAQRWRYQNPASTYTGGLFKDLYNTSTIDGDAYFKIQTTDAPNQVYKTKATVAELVNVPIGIVTTTTTKGNSAPVCFGGYVSGLSGLTAGTLYFVSDTRGTLGASAGTVSTKVGVALSTTELFIQVHVV